MLSCTGLQVWPEEDFPLQPVGVMRLDRNIDNFHNESEQIAFSPAITVGGETYCCYFCPHALHLLCKKLSNFPQIKG